MWHTEMWHRGKGESAAHAACVRGPARECGQKAQAEAHTWNMERMLVTLEVSQLEMSASKFFNLMKSWLMSVIPETSQSAMGPYVAVAEATLAL